MHDVLVFTPDPAGLPGVSVIDALRSANCNVFASALDGPARQEFRRLTGAFDGRPPHMVVSDLSRQSDCVALRDLRRLMRDTWGGEISPPGCLALISPNHIAHPDWLAYMDDFLLPPYSTIELLARVKLLLFRQRNVHHGDVLRFGSMTIDLAARRAFDADRNVLPLTPREFDLLRFLAAHRGRLFTREQLLDMVWGIGFDGGDRTVDIHIRRLRVKLPATASGLLETRRGVGYGICVDAH